MMNSATRWLSCALSLSLSLFACASEETATLEVEVGTTSQALAAEAPREAEEATGDGAEAVVAARHLRVVVREIRVHVAAQGGGDAEEGEGGAGWTTVFAGERTIDLDSASSLGEILGSAEVPAGRLTQLRLVLDGAASLVDADGTERAMACPSCDTSGLKIFPTQGAAREARLGEGAAHRARIAVDTNLSVIEDGEQLLLRPVVRLELTSGGAAQEARATAQPAIADTGRVAE
jgi:hypothetical protein